MPLLPRSKLPTMRTVIETAPVVVIEKVEVKEERIVRMYHPDSTPDYPISCSFTMDGEEVKIVRGIAEVTETLANKLEKKGWRRGNYADEFHDKYV